MENIVLQFAIQSRHTFQFIGKNKSIKLLIEYSIDVEEIQKEVTVVKSIIVKHKSIKL